MVWVVYSSWWCDYSGVLLYAGWWCTRVRGGGGWVVGASWWWERVGGVGRWLMWLMWADAWCMRDGGGLGGASRANQSVWGWWLLHWC